MENGERQMGRNPFGVDCASDGEVGWEGDFDYDGLLWRNVTMGFCYYERSFFGMPRDLNFV